MPFVLPADPVAGASAPASWGDDVRAALNYLANPPAARVYNNAVISHATSGSWQTLTFNSERYDTASLHSTSVNTGRLTLPDAGIYIVTGIAEFAGNATGNRGLQLIRNGAGSTIAGIWVPAAASPIGTGLSLTTVYKFAAGDYVELQAYQSSGGALNVQANNGPEFSATWIGLG